MRMWQALTVLSAFVRPEEASLVVEQIWLLLKARPLPRLSHDTASCHKTHCG